MTDAAVLNVGDASLEMPIIPATVGQDGFDASKILAKTGKVALDVGFVNTASCSSAITFIDGDEGILRYRGYPIEQLAEQSTFLEVAYLLIHGELPTQEELDHFEGKITRRMMLDERLKEMYRAFPRGAHPMMVLAAGVIGLGAFNRTTLDPHDPSHIEEST